MKITLKKHNHLFSFHDESKNVPETDFHENPRWPPIWRPYEPHGTLDTITITKNVGYKYIYVVHGDPISRLDYIDILVTISTLYNCHFVIYVIYSIV